MYNDLKNINHTIIKNNNNCFICLKDIDYHIKFDCKCHNYLHTDCVNNYSLTECFICHKKITKLDLLTKKYKIFIPDFESLNHYFESLF